MSAPTRDSLHAAAGGAASREHAGGVGSCPAGAAAAASAARRRARPSQGCVERAPPLSCRCPLRPAPRPRRAPAGGPGVAEAHLVARVEQALLHGRLTPQLHPTVGKVAGLPVQAGAERGVGGAHARLEAAAQRSQRMAEASTAWRRGQQARAPKRTPGPAGFAPAPNAPPGPSSARRLHERVRSRPTWGARCRNRWQAPPCREQSRRQQPICWRARPGMGSHMGVQPANMWGVVHASPPHPPTGSRPRCAPPGSCAPAGSSLRARRGRQQQQSGRGTRALCGVLPRGGRSQRVM